MQIDMFQAGVSRKTAAAPLSFPFALRGRAVAAKRAPLRLASALFVESLDFDAASAHTAQWQGLAARALEPNVFAEPACTLAAAQHFADVHRPRFLFVWTANGIDERSELLGVCPMYVPSRLESRRLALTWTHDHAPLATPLLDERRASAVLEAILDFGRQEMPAARGFVFRGAPRFGATATRLQDLARTRGLACELSAPETPSGKREPGAVPLAASAHRLAAAFASRRADLEKAGAVSFRTLRHPSDVRHATEEFFALDALACRDRGNGILGRSDATTFVRALTRMLSSGGKCRIDRLAVDDAPIAMSIVISGGNRDYVWKLACNPAQGAFDPEGQLMLAHVRAEPDAPPLALADRRRETDGTPRSVEIWTDTLPMSDVAVASTPDRGRGFATAMRRRSGWRKFRAAFGRR